MCCANAKLKTIKQVQAEKMSFRILSSLVVSVTTRPRLPELCAEFCGQVIAINEVRTRDHCVTGLAIIETATRLYLLAGAIEHKVFPVAVFRIEAGFALHHHRQQFRRRAVFRGQLFLDDDRALREVWRLIFHHRLPADLVDEYGEKFVAVRIILDDAEVSGSTQSCDVSVKNRWYRIDSRPVLVVSD